MKIIVLIIVLTFSIKGQCERVLLGRVIDEETSKPLKNVAIGFYTGDTQCFSNIIGFFELKINDTINYLSFQHISYGTLEIKIPNEDKFTVRLVKRQFVYPAVDFVDFDQAKLPINNFLIDSLLDSGYSSDKIKPAKCTEQFGLIKALSEAFLLSDSISDKLIIEHPPIGYSLSISFTVKKDGSVSNVILGGDTLSELGNKTRATIRNMKWKSAIQNGESCDQQIKIPINYGNIVYTFVDNNAFCDAEKFRSYFKKNMKYPKEAKRMGVEGKVFVGFIENKFGKTIKNKIEVVKGICCGLNEEALRLASNFPLCDPGSQNGRKVYTKFIIPILFKLP